MSHPQFTPIPLFRTDPTDPKTAISQDQWTDADHAAMETMFALYDDIDGFRDTERNLQTRIGISDIGGDCDVCFMRKMAELPKNPNDNGSWKTQLGTYVHGGLEADFMRRYGDSGERLAEGRLVVDEYKGRVLAGSCDMFVPNLPAFASDFDDYDGTHSVQYDEAIKTAPGIVVDWKIPSTDEDAHGKLKPSTTMQKTVAGKVSRQYLVQANLYGRGWVNKGYNVTHVCIFYIPSFGQLWHARPVVMRYSPEWAEWGINRWRAALDARDVFMSLGATEEQAWQHLIKQQSKANFCFSCKHYEEMEHNGSGLALLNQTPWLSQK